SRMERSFLRLIWNLVFGVHVLVSETSFHNLLSREPNLILHEAAPLFYRAARLLSVNLSDVIRELIKDIRLFTHDFSVTRNPRPWIVNHHHSEWRNHNLITSKGDEGRSGSRQTVDVGSRKC